MNITSQQNKATGELVDLVAAKVGSNRAIHPETAISTSARLAGSLLLRSFNFQLERLTPGSVLLSDEANEKGPILINTLAAFLSASNISLDQAKLGGQQDQRGQEPQLDILNALSKLQEEAIKTCVENGLTMEQAAQSAALATAFIVKECAPQIGAEIGFNVAVYGFIEGSKTVPPIVATMPKSPASAKPWYKFWQ
ncbi:MAG: hypothetical protein H6R16_977 [Proteobacteria bacterium]|nr:hypothetical protein [Pseudomonadota bacterium]